MKRLLMLSAVTRANRHMVMQQVNDIVVSCGGWIEGHTLFSNIAATFRFVLPQAGLAAFAEQVNAAGVHIDAAGLAAVAQRAAVPAEEPDAAAASYEVAGALSVTFVHDEPDLRREIPAVPG
ncbi:hypothetical protein [Hoeflea sp.]|uniref:hypothetical protein n=1 Tax=Hoeflea sp. TaxID=1940281 RepID=UPI003A93C24F